MKSLAWVCVLALVLVIAASPVAAAPSAGEALETGVLVAENGSAETTLDSSQAQCGAAELTLSSILLGQGVAGAGDGSDDFCFCSCQSCYDYYDQCTSNNPSPLCGLIRDRCLDRLGCN